MSTSQDQLTIADIAKLDRWSMIELAACVVPIEKIRQWIALGDGHTFDRNAWKANAVIIAIEDFERFSCLESLEEAMQLCSRAPLKEQEHDYFERARTLASKASRASVVIHDRDRREFYSKETIAVANSASYCASAVMFLADGAAIAYALDSESCSDRTSSLVNKVFESIRYSVAAGASLRYVWSIYELKTMEVKRRSDDLHGRGH